MQRHELFWKTPSRKPASPQRNNNLGGKQKKKRKKKRFNSYRKHHKEKTNDRIGQLVVDVFNTLGTTASPLCVLAPVLMYLTKLQTHTISFNAFSFKKFSVSSIKHIFKKPWTHLSHGDGLSLSNKCKFKKQRWNWLTVKYLVHD